MWSKLIKMEYAIFMVLLIPGSCVLSTPEQNAYHFVSQKMNWDDALVNCILTYTDLAQIQSSKNVTAAMETWTSGYTGKAWIGLFKILSDWTWVDGEPLTYSRWTENQPNNNYGDEFCVCINKNGEWLDAQCSLKKSHVCFNGNKIKFYSQQLTWNNSKAHCESVDSELAVIPSENVNHNIKENLDEDAWIGLSKPTLWYWSESDELLTFQNWKSGQPNNTEVDSCAAIQLSDGTWSDEPCETALPSLCYGVKRVTKTWQKIIKVKIQSSANMENGAVASQLRQQLHNALAQQGLSEFKLTWRKTPVKIQEQQQRDEICSNDEVNYYEDEPDFT